MTAIAQTGTTFEDGTYEIEEVADDPFVTRFLSPDPVIQSPGNAQNYNRYSYALNNPLKYTDPSGYKYRGADMGDNPGGFVNNGFKLPQNGTMGSGSHWSDGMMGEYHDFVFGSSKKFDAKYGVGAHNIGWSVWSDSYLAEKWRADDISIYDVDIVEVFEVKTKTENWVGTEKNPYQILVSTDEVTSYELVVKGNELNAISESSEQISIDESHNRIGFVPLDVGKNYGAFQMANYRANISIRGNQNKIFVGVTNSNTPVYGGQVVFNASASLVVDGDVIQKQVLVDGSARFELMNVSNVSITVQGGWNVYFDSGGASVPVYHPTFWPFSLNFKDNFKIK